MLTVSRFLPSVQNAAGSRGRWYGQPWRDLRHFRPLTLFRGIRRRNTPYGRETGRIRGRLPAECRTAVAVSLPTPALAEERRNGCIARRTVNSGCRNAGMPSALDVRVDQRQVSVALPPCRVTIVDRCRVHRRRHSRRVPSSSRGDAVRRRQGMRRCRPYPQRAFGSGGRTVLYKKTYVSSPEMRIYPIYITTIHDLSATKRGKDLKKIHEYANILQKRLPFLRERRIMNRYK